MKFRVIARMAMTALVAVAIAGCATPQPAPAGGTVAFVAKTLAEKGVRP
ncbi:hypothetical protein [Inquilinus sp.]|jgi:hypothetical protein